MVKRAPPKTSSTMLGLEAQLWDAANALRGSIDPSEYKRVVLGPLSLEYISDAFEEHPKRLSAEEPYANPEYPDEYRVDNIFRIPLEARCSKLQKNVHQPIIEKLVTRRIPEPHSAIHPQYPPIAMEDVPGKPVRGPASHLCKGSLIMARPRESQTDSLAPLWLESLGWQIGHGSKIVPDRLFAERQNYRQASLEQRLRSVFTLKIMHRYIWVGDKAQAIRITL